MKLSAVACLAVFLLCLTAHAQSKTPPVTLAAVDRQHVLQDTFVVSHTTAAIPDSVKQASIFPSFEPTFLVAEPGKPYNTSDVGEAGVPWQRLIFVATSAEYCVLHFEHGGFGGAQQEVAIFHLTNDKAVQIYAAGARSVLANLDALRYGVQQNWRFASDRQHMMQDTFVVSRTTSAIPLSVTQALARQNDGKPFRIAEPGQKFETKYTSGHPALPAARLVFCAVSQNVCILHYERGGYAPYSSSVAVFHLSGDNATIVYSGLGTDIYHNLTDLRWAMRSRTVRETLSLFN